MKSDVEDMNRTEILTKLADGSSNEISQLDVSNVELNAKGVIKSRQISSVLLRSRAYRSYQLQKAPVLIFIVDGRSVVWWQAQSNVIHWLACLQKVWAVWSWHVRTVVWWGHVRKFELWMPTLFNKRLLLMVRMAANNTDHTWFVFFFFLLYSWQSHSHVSQLTRLRGLSHEVLIKSHSSHGQWTI